MTAERAGNPGVHFPPPFVFVGGFLLGFALDRWAYPLRLGGAARPVLVAGGWLFIAGGVAFMLWAMAMFRRARTSVLPFRPASAMVTTGPYRFTRNPMYVGLTVLYVGLCLLTGMLWPLVMLPFVLVALTTLVIRREERYLEDAFGAEYAAYRARVRRWL
ncbi:MAG: methyltransferase family protein [Gemmatimonadaceae bacterium]